MLALRSLREVGSGAIRGYYSERHWLYAVFSSDVHAYALWGMLEVEELRGLLRFWNDSFKTMKAHAILADVRHLTFVSPQAFALLLDYFRSNENQLRKMVLDSCVVHDSTLTGAVAAGFFGITAAPFPFSMTTDMSAAARSLGLSTSDLSEYETRRCVVQSDADVVSRLQHILEHNLLHVDSARLAKLLGFSERSMQRKLRDRGTSLSEQVSHARIERARAILETTGASVTEVAFAVGFRSLEHFSRSFRARCGIALSAYRTTITRSSSSDPKP